MAKSVTVNFDDGTSHTYDNVPDDVTDDEVTQRAGSEFGDKTVAGVGSAGGAGKKEDAGGAVAPEKELSIPEKVAGGVATAASLAIEHPAIPAAAAGLYKANKVANTYIQGKEAETAALNQRTQQQAQTAAAHQNIQQQKIDLKKSQMGSGQPYKFSVDPQTGAGKLSINQPTVTPQQQVTPQMSQQMPAQPATAQAPQAAPKAPVAPAAPAGAMPQAAPAAPKLEGVLGQARNVVQKLALGKVLKGAGLAGAAYEIGSNLFSTSPDEIEAMKRQEAAKRAQGWKPLNER